MISKEEIKENKKRRKSRNKAISDSRKKYYADHKKTAKKERESKDIFAFREKLRNKVKI